MNDLETHADELAELTYRYHHETDPVRRAGLRAAIRRLSEPEPVVSSMRQLDPHEAPGPRSGLLGRHRPAHEPSDGPWGSARLARLLGPHTGTPDPEHHEPNGKNP